MVKSVDVAADGTVQVSVYLTVQGCPMRDQITQRVTDLPEGFRPHPTVQRILNQRRQMGMGEQPIDWGLGEHLAFIVSDEIYRGIIRHEYRFIDASTFRPVRLSRKELDTTAWVHVPGYPAPPGLPPAETAPPPKGPDPQPPVVASTHIHGDQVFGDKFIGNKNVYGAGPA